MAVNYSNIEKWGLNEVLIWLNCTNLAHFIRHFERTNMDGPMLLKIDETFIRTKLRITAPAECLILKQAIATLNLEVQQAKLTARRGSALDMPLNLPPAVPPAGGSKKSQTLYSPGRVGPLLDGSASSRTFSTMASAVPPNATLPPPPKPLTNKSAKELLEYKCKYGGWIKKQGGRHRTWRDRYLILSEGCLYYFVNEKAARPKGAFSLDGYSVEEPEDPIKQKFPYSMKLVPTYSPDSERVYYFVFMAKHELDTWKGHIEDEIEMMQRMYSVVYNSKVNGICPISEAPDQILDEEEDPPYESVPDGMPIDDHASPNLRINSLSSEPDDPENPYARIADNIVTDGHTPLPGNPTNKAPVPPRRPSFTLNALDNGDQNGHGEASDGKGIYVDLVRAEKLKKIFNQTRPSGSPSDYSSSDDDDDEAGGGYIRFPTEDDVFPKIADFDQLTREEAKGKLEEERYDGMYLIRGSQNAETADRVLSVWNKDKARHYKIFHDKATDRFSLTQGDAFTTIPTLLTHYRNSELPKSDFCLTVPYGYTQ